MKLDKTVVIGGLALGLSAYSVYSQNKDPSESENGGFFDFLGGSSAEVDGTIIPTSNTETNRTETIEGVPQIVFNDAEKLTNTYANTKKGSKVSFSYDSSRNVNTINVDGVDVGEYDYKNNVSRDLTLSSSSSSGGGSSSSKKSNNQYVPSKKVSDLMAKAKRQAKEYDSRESKKSTKKEEKKNFFSKIGVRA